VKLTGLHNAVDDLERWLSTAVHSLKRDGSSTDKTSVLKVKIENLYR